MRRLFFVEVMWSTKNGTITIQNRGNHRIKNKQSKRTIPICIWIKDSIRGMLLSSTVQPTDEAALFLNAIGEPWTKSSIEGACKRAMSKLRVQSHYWKEDCRLPDGFDFSRLRHTFQDICRQANANYMLTEIYVGHKPEGMGAQRYWGEIPIAELRTVVEAFEIYFENFLKTFKNSKSIND